MLNIDLDSFIQNNSFSRKLETIISSIKITPSDLKKKKKNITRIWKKIITSKLDTFLNLLNNIGINYKDLNKRVCCYCGRKIDFINFFYLNSSLGLGKVVEIWQNNLIQFYCDNCDEKKD